MSMSGVGAALMRGWGRPSWWVGVGRIFRGACPTDMTSRGMSQGHRGNVCGAC